MVLLIPFSHVKFSPVILGGNHEWFVCVGPLVGWAGGSWWTEVPGFGTVIYRTSPVRVRSSSGGAHAFRFGNLPDPSSG